LKNTFDEYKNKNGCCYDVILSKNGMTHLVLIVRNSMKVHSGQIAFLEKWETEDENFSVTALETHEEVGIHPDKMEIIKFYIPISLK
jgi:hypothetical protein